ncbi:hypothetical protein C6P40_001300 [Pichia californica]|uniref:GH18 domain-containing protein n=1 Tax=Pichia californica TaxID=460514 RepID=A0A9P7BDJ6_9ASCO|nr:hypothetical protein C6P42_005427 [[Candida] californica]KAG0688187.1 hypothetical protein C6P40_001300 [[Candida] californica]
MTPIFSPYIFAWGHNNDKYYQTNNLQHVINLGLKNITLAFLTNERYDEIKEWRDDILLHKDDINIILSIGGATGTFPSSSIENDVEKLNNLLNDLNINMIDLDIEGKILESKDKVKQWVKLIKLLCLKRKNENEDLWISLTLPVEFEGGLNNDSIFTIKLFQKEGILINLINLMLMDYFTPLKIFNNWGDKNISILINSFNQLKKFGYNWNNIGICPMIGENDDGTKFTINDWEKLLLFANLNKIGLISFWAINRDQKSHLFSKSGVDTHSKCQNCDHEYTLTAIKMLNK